MDYALIFRTVAPILVSLLSNTSGAFKTDEPPVSSPLIAVSGPKASQAIRDLQILLNEVLKLNPPLIEDGWLGNKTEAAIEQAIVMVRNYGIGNKL